MAEPYRAVRRIFHSPQGLRPVWRVFLFLAMVGVPAGILQAAVIHFHLLHGDAVTPQFLIPAELAAATIIFLATAVIGRMEGRSVLSYGLGSAHPVTEVVTGWVGGLLSLSVLVGVLHTVGFLVFDRVALRPLEAACYGLAWLLGFLLIGLSEEMMFRGYLQTALSRRLGFWNAAILLSAAFAAVHLRNGGENVIGVSQTFVAGLLFCALLRVSGSLWLGIGFHAAWDWAQSYLYGTADSALVFQGHLLDSHPVGSVLLSGGSAGPEGSALAPLGFVLCPLLLTWIWFGVVKKGARPGAPGSATIDRPPSKADPHLVLAGKNKHGRPF